MTVLFSAHSIGQLVQQQIQIEKLKLGEVANVFRTSIYIRTTTGDLLHVTSRPLRSPITLNVQAPNLDFRSAIEAGELVTILAEKICIGGLKIEIGQAAEYSGHLPSFAIDPSVESIPTCIKKTVVILKILEKDNSVLDGESLYHAVLNEFVRTSISELVEGHPENFGRQAAKIVGFGAGFTPTGDDVVGGILIAYNALAPTIGLSSIHLPLASILERTTWASGQLLNYMQHLILDEQILRILHAIANGSDKSFLAGTMDLVARGHTSGLDILTGIVLGLSTINEFHSRNDLTLYVRRTLGFVQPVDYQND